MTNNDFCDVLARRLLSKHLTKFCWSWALILEVSIYSTSLAAQTQSSVRQPTLNIFSTQVIENIKETGNAARTLENDLQGVIEQLEQQQQLYYQSKCEGAVGDQGCAQISKQMADTYQKMLITMGERLPDMERNITTTRDSLQTRLNKELGHNRTGQDLQQLLRKQQGDQVAQHRTRVRREGARLSDRFRQYFNLVNQSSSESLALLGAEMYLDMDETAELIQLTQQQIRRARLVVDLSDSFGTITPEMRTTVSEVKRIIFGEYDAEANQVPANLNRTEKPGKFCSEFDPNC